MKLLVVNLQNPHETKYMNPKSIGSWLLGRRLSNYPLFAVDNDGTMTPITFDTGNVIVIQKIVTDALNFT